MEWMCSCLVKAAIEKEVGKEFDFPPMLGALRERELVFLFSTSCQTQRRLRTKGEREKELEPIFSEVLAEVFVFFLRLYCAIGISPIRNSGCSPRGKPAATESRYQTYGACWLFSVFIIHRTLTWTTGFLMCAQMLINACDCAEGVYGHT